MQVQVYRKNFLVTGPNLLISVYRNSMHDL